MKGKHMRGAALTKTRKELGRVKRRISRKLVSLRCLVAPRQKLVIFDDFFPHPLSPFRTEEYNAYLRHFKSVTVFSTAESFSCMKESLSIGEVIHEYEAVYPEFIGKVKPFSEGYPIKARLAYTMFLHNTFRFLRKMEKLNLPFVFTLYPGGGFKIGERDSDDQLRRIFNSTHFRKVIVTQPLTYDYLIDNTFCGRESIELIYGVVTPEKALHGLAVPKQLFGIDKDTLDICFVAHKYMAKGIDKGYDVFIDAAKILAAKVQNIRFHVVGGFDEDDIPLNGIGDKIRFYGPRETSWLSDFYHRIDVILSPNVPFVLRPGSFDGFPTGSCTEACLCGVAMFCSDELGLNRRFIDREEIVIIPRNPSDIADSIIYYYNNPDELHKLAERGALKARHIYDYNNQVLPRLSLLESILNSEENN